MSEAERQEGEQKGQNRIKELIDLSDSRHMIHWTLMKNLSRILESGIYSPVYAERINE